MLSIHLSRRRFLKQAALTGAALTVPFVCGRFADAAGGIDPSAVKKFAASLNGRLIVPTDKDYEIARKLWNGRFDKRPAMIARCAGTDDVRRAVEFARKRLLQVSVRSGGHDAAGFSCNDGGMVLDLGSMNAIRVGPDRKTVSAAAGAHIGDLYREVGNHHLAAVCGACPSVGLGGIITGGGEGWIMDKFGTASDNVLAAEVVTADGQVIHADSNHSPDLFWAIRGGSGNFGVVTRFDLRAIPLEPITKGSLAFPLSRYYDVCRYLDDFARTMPDELSLAVPCGVPGPLDRGFVTVCYFGDPARAARAIQPLRSFVKPLTDDIRVAPGTNGLMDTPEPPRGAISFWDAAFVRHLDVDVARVMHNSLHEAPRGYALFFVWIGGAAARGTSAYPLRGGGFSLEYSAFALNGATPSTAEKWVRELSSALRPYSAGAYVNVVGVAGDAHEVFGANYNRLLAIKDKYDPTNFFHMNQNLKPTV